MNVNHSKPGVATLLEQLRATADLRRQSVRVDKKPPRYYGPEDLVAREGLQFIARPAPYSLVRQATLKQCFANCVAAARSKRSPWLYVEGFAMTGEFPLAVHHAWLTRGDEPTVAVDPTWSILPTDLKDAVYFGIPLAIDFVMATRRSSPLNEYGALSAWWTKPRLLTGDLKVEAVIPSGYPFADLRRSPDDQARRSFRS